ncbi:YceD family protein [Thiomicrorhabdus xiamenensis]|uniref:Large ribosomal RNA subunit accumulation protein YceD n=1 Tax=Thiomicrorhabdus xiamenensis TaxID=2739063 RepID=A0A7D4SIN8_9GAMM|nr:YceD family protein [Thiomicrorhabdus xiamenensis]QKI88919.1 DUF177 domain-containing protein [Thiomicrorhabdus xiamenensis]
MLNKLPDYIDPIYAVKHDKHYVGRVNMSQFTRLAEQVESASQDATVDIRFYYDKALGFPAFELNVEAVLNLQCQRSLNTFDFPVKAHMKGVFTESMALVEDLPKEVEAFELEGDKISLLGLVEEELLLCVPMVPIDESSEMAYQNADDDGQIEDSTNGSEEPKSEKQNPFAVLQGLKK